MFIILCEIVILGRIMILFYLEVKHGMQFDWISPPYGLKLWLVLST